MLLNQDPLYSANYRLTSVEREVLTKLLLMGFKHTGFKFSATTLLLLKELDFDIRKVIRIVQADLKSTYPLFNRSFFKRFLMIIKEAIVLVALEANINSENPNSLSSLTQKEKFKRIGIDRNMIYRVVRKYNIDLTDQSMLDRIKNCA